ncbi:hypothetical protein TRFO_30406 [Tritrichomonas foetus]|uniref:CYRIA/CYRIB Rac1 binding domain-containing protein n=1 Tax=Tritrichomonas foetus TaxID=1144522 RepID=A0A1J4JYW8_9EUKA|nr:hypothetical protein TRFO_30406 [Tritrichomonas foetus]|eukprot:OHT02461.1 hypothetical protein TRFO_30406 [Tritrichomonas foetus]
MTDAVQVPPQEIIEEWNKISDLPIVETVPRSVPLSVFVKYPTDGYLSHVFSGRSKITASETEKFSELVESSIQMIEKSLTEFYTSRCVSKPLFSYIESLKTDQNKETPAEFQKPEAVEAARKLLMPIIRMFRGEKEMCISCSFQIKIFFTDESFWKQGKYNDVFLDRICLLFYRITALEQLIPSKKSVINDLTQLSKLANNPKLKQDVGQIQLFIMNVRSISGMIMHDLESVSPELSIAIFDAMFQHIKKNLEKTTFLNPEMQFAYITSLVFFIQFYENQRLHELKTVGKKSKPKMKELSSSVRDFVSIVMKAYPITPLFFELAEETAMNLPTEFKNHRPSNSSPTLERLSIEHQLKSLRYNFTELSHVISIVANDETKKEEKGPIICSMLQRIIHQMCVALNDIRVLLAFNQAHPPKCDDEKMSLYERSMRLGLQSHLDIILLMLHSCRSTKELIQSNLPILQECIAQSIQRHIQFFVKEKLKEILAHNPGSKKILGPIIELLRVVAGYFTEEEYKFDDKKEKRKFPGKNEKLISSPNLDILALLRNQLQAMTNPESPFVNKTGGVFSSVLLSSADAKEMSTFVAQSRYYIDLICLSDTIDIACDQSNLYFKETYLSIYDVSFFPVTISLPVILSEHALENYKKPELTGVIFYPLSIYDDAASKALRLLKSKYLYDEIKAEAEICLISITTKISDSIFWPIRTFASLRSMKQDYLKQLTDQMRTPIYENVTALRMGVILEQNQLFVLGCYIDTKSLLAERLHKIFNEQIQIIVSNLIKNGVLAAIAVSKLIDMLRSTHQMFIQFGLPLMPFDDILSHAMCTDTPNSLQSMVLSHAVKNLKKHIRQFYLRTHPLVLIPRYVPHLDISGQSAYVALMSMYLDRTMQLLSVESFRCLFWLMEDGSIAIMQGNVVESIEKVFDQFTVVYSAIKNKFKRIKFSTALSCNQMYDRYEGAYSFFSEDRDLHDLIRLMGEIGNVLALAEMMDSAYLMKRETSLQNRCFIFGQNPKQEGPPENPEFYQMFDNEFQSSRKMFDYGECLPSSKELVSPFLYNALARITAKVRSSDLFMETSSNLLDGSSLTGFVSVWSIVEFLMCMIEKNNTEDDPAKSTLQLYGESPFLTASAVIDASRQKSLYNAFNISNKITESMKTNVAVNEKSGIYKFKEVHDFIASTMQCYLSNYEPAICLMLETPSQ